MDKKQEDEEKKKQEVDMMDDGEEEILTMIITRTRERTYLFIYAKISWIFPVPLTAFCF